MCAICGSVDWHRPARSVRRDQSHDPFTAAADAYSVMFFSKAIADIGRCSDQK
jgi:hypothetical protein